MKHVPSYIIPKMSNLPIRQSDAHQPPGQTPTTNPDDSTTPASSSNLKTSFHKKPNLNHTPHQSSRGGRGGGRGGRKKNPLKSFTSS
ncbi:hypothetical protein KEM48_006934 [Puccinia striiformis f. sp. tritici PST-130]|nr:hypothetical protein H4Q26_006913 [Puccinia striiformis f. sp. tritici PST-130]KAI9617995.1 hypothetical protein KEM48_006934 [Puccinia striiformis f. sp. tritici PST-130]